MKVLNDYFSILCFFIAWVISHSIYTATLTGIIAMLAQVAFLLLLRKKITSMQWITLGAWVIFGGMTLIFHNPVFIQWKPSIFYWILSIILLVNRFTNATPLLKRMLGEKVAMPTTIWNLMSLQWAAFLFFMGALNIYVAYTYSMDTWVKFKLFGCLGITLVFAVVQSIFLNKHITEVKK